MNIFEQLRDWFLQPLMGQAYMDRRDDIKNRRDYRRGKQKPPLKSADDNVIINFVGLIVDRGVSMLFGKDITFDLPGDTDTAEQKYIDSVWDANRKSKLLKSTAEYGAESGTCYLKILPDTLITKDGESVPRLVALDPASVSMETETNDCDMVIKYTIAYATIDKVTDKETVYKQVIEQEKIEDTKNGLIFIEWVICNYHADSSGDWILDDKSPWQYDFPPIIHWQNMPENGSPYGKPDVTDDIINLQDRFNFVVSNTAKIIKYHAHPKTWGRKFGKVNKVAWGVDEMVLSDNDAAHLENLEMQSDLGSSLNFIRFLRQAMFDIARSVDIDSLSDKLGALTNFALKVLYQDAISKLDDKRGSYGEALVEINHRLLELKGMGNTDGGEIFWPQVLPINELEQANALQADMNLGVVSKQTAAIERGRNWEVEQKRIEEDKLDTDNVGAALLRAFGQGK